MRGQRGAQLVGDVGDEVVLGACRGSRSSSRGSSLLDRPGRASFASARSLRASATAAHLARGRGPARTCRPVRLAIRWTTSSRSLQRLGDLGQPAAPGAGQPEAPTTGDEQDAPGSCPRSADAPRSSLASADPRSNGQPWSRSLAVAERPRSARCPRRNSGSGRWSPGRGRRRAAGRRTSRSRSSAASSWRASQDVELGVDRRRTRSTSLLVAGQLGPWRLAERRPAPPASPLIA